MPTSKQVRSGSAADQSQSDSLLKKENAGSEEPISAQPEYHTEMLSPLYADDRGMLLKPKKKKEYRFSKAIDIVPENLSPLAASKNSLVTPKGDFRRPQRTSIKAERGCCGDDKGDDEMSQPCTRCNIY